MADELVEIGTGLLEIGLESTINSKRPMVGCSIMIILLALLIGGVYYFSIKDNTPPIRGLIVKKLSNNRMVIKTSTSENVYLINNELYINKNVGDSITLSK